MTTRTARLHDALLKAFGVRATNISSLNQKPLQIDLGAADPLLLRIYMYSLVGGTGERARREYKVVLRVRDHAVGEYRSFDHSGGRFTTIVGYDAGLEVFVFWDASLHPRFKNGSNLQVRDEIVRMAAVSGAAQQTRVLSSGAREVVLACQASELMRTLEARIASTGGLMEGECPTFLS
jgi:hypothetical protein